MAEGKKKSKTKKTADEKVTLDGAFAFWIVRTARLLRYDFLQMAARNELEITPEQWFILNKLRNNGGQSQVELTDDIFNDRPNITRILRSMESKDMVYRKSSVEDKRKQLVYLTDEGKRVHDKLADIMPVERKRVYDDLTPQDLKDLKRILGTVEKNILGT